MRKAQNEEQSTLNLLSSRGGEVCWGSIFQSLEKKKAKKKNLRKLKSLALLLLFWFFKARPCWASKELYRILKQFNSSQRCVCCIEAVLWNRKMKEEQKVSNLPFKGANRKKKKVLKLRNMLLWSVFKLMIYKQLQVFKLVSCGQRPKEENDIAGKPAVWLRGQPA